MKIKSLERALTFLRNQIDSGCWKTGERLPNARTLAQLADVGYASILSALDILKRKKKVSFKKKVGIFAGPEIPRIKKQPAVTPSLKQVQKKKFEKIKEIVHKDIVTGTFHNQDKLPSIKELSRYYHSDYTVIKKAMTLLVNDGLIYQEKKHYRILRQSVGVSNNTLYLFVHQNFQNNSVWHFERDWCNLFIRTIETACYERSIRLIKHYYSGPEPIHADLSNTLGSIVFHSNNTLRVPQYQDTLDLLMYLKNFNNPVICINMYMDERDSIANTMLGTSKNFFFSDQSINKAAGVKVGQILLAHGHRRICFFAPADLPVYQERFNGLFNCFGSAGVTEPIQFIVPKNSLYALKDSDPSFKVMVEPLKKELEMGRIFTKDQTQTNLMTHLLADMDKVSNCLSACSGMSIDVPASIVSGDMYEAMLAVQKMQLPTQFKSLPMNSMQETSNAAGLLRTFTPLFEQALTYPDITAWVCAEDNLTNAAAFEFCKQKGIKIPQDLGLVGFQDHFESCTNNITSYHFDFARTALKALSLVTHPRHSAKLFCKKDSGEFAFEGMVIDRGSV